MLSLPNFKYTQTLTNNLIDDSLCMQGTRILALTLTLTLTLQTQEGTWIFTTRIKEPGFYNQKRNLDFTTRIKEPGFYNPNKGTWILQPKKGTWILQPE